jgi:hypothetical protein
VADELAELTSMPIEFFHEVEISRNLGGGYTVSFPSANPLRSVDKKRVSDLLENAQLEMSTAAPLKSEQDLKERLTADVAAAMKVVAGAEAEIEDDTLASILAALKPLTDAAAKTSTIVPQYLRLREEIENLRKEVSQPHPDNIKEARQLAVKHLPSFVYYSNYGNLDSEIYLPHVIENMKREDLGAKEQAKARTLKVLFEFVGLEPDEILELGLDFRSTTRQPTEEELAAITEKKKQRSILLQSASTKLTQEFRSWWRQGEYRFRFEADGDHFRIWVSDDKRPEEIELEGRSTGLQWFLSFYLVFLVESKDAHEGAILLLDEPGLSLHPLAQRDLSAFFDGLTETNQLLYTTHSPFLVDADRLDRARKVFVSVDGTTRVTSDLRANDSDPFQKGAGYAVHAALGLSVAESLLLGCTPVVVEGPSDQLYLSAIKTLLISAGQLQPGRELVFPPPGGAKGVKAVASILGGRDEELPVALFDSDHIGNETVKSLKGSLYAKNDHLLLQVGSFVSTPNAEIEDLIPIELIAKEVDRLYRSADQAFAEVVQPGRAITDQIEDWAKKNKITLESPGWKVELAKRIKGVLLAKGEKSVSPPQLEVWKKLFDAFRAAPVRQSTVEANR